MWWFFKKKKRNQEVPLFTTLRSPFETVPLDHEPIMPRSKSEPVSGTTTTNITVTHDILAAAASSLARDTSSTKRRRDYSSDEDLVVGDYAGMTAVDILLGVEINAKYPDIISESEIRSVIGLVRDGNDDHQARAVDVLLKLVETSKSIRTLMAKNAMYTSMDDALLPILATSAPESVRVSICDIYTTLYAYCILGSRMDIREIRNVYMSILRTPVDTVPLSRCLLGLERLTTTSHQAQDLVDEGAVQLMCGILAQHKKIPVVCRAAIAMLELLTTTRHGQLALMKHESRALAQLLDYHQAVPDARIVNLLCALDNDDCAEAMASSDQTMELLTRALSTSHDKSLADALLGILETVCEHHGANVRKYINMNLNIFRLYKHPEVELPTKIRLEYVLQLLGLDPESS